MDKNYYVIENDGEASPKSFFVMGMTSKSVEDETIGQFGTGNKYGLAAVLRFQDNITITTGLKRLKFSLQEEKFRGKTCKMVYVKVGRKTVPAGFTSEIGVLNWDLASGIRELICNAIDEGGYRFFTADTISGKKGKTRVFLPAIEGVKNYFEQVLDKTFTFNRKAVFQNDHGIAYEKQPGSDASVFRKGVRVYTNKVNSVYDYDLFDVAVGEDRSSSLWDVRWELQKLLDDAPVHAKKKILKLLREDHECLEECSALDHCTPSSDWAMALEDAVIVTPEEAKLYRDHLVSFDPFVLPLSWVGYLSKREEVLTIESVLSKQSLKGWEDVCLNAYDEEIIEEAVSILHRAGYDIVRNDVIVANNNQSDILGSYLEGEIYINLKAVRGGLDLTLETLAEELFHKMSKAYDNTREFQTFLIRQALYHVKQRLFLEDLYGRKNERTVCGPSREGGSEDQGE